MRLRYVWRMYIFWNVYIWGRCCASEHFTRMSLPFSTLSDGDLMAHATNDIQHGRCRLGEGVMSAVDASLTAIVTLFTLYCCLDCGWPWCHPCLLWPWEPVPWKRLNHLAFKSSQEAFSKLSNHVQEAVSGISR